MTPQADSASNKSIRSYLLAVLFLLLTAVLSLIWSHVRLMWNDEFLSFYSDSVATFKQVILVQLHHPISLDPPTYHLLSHLSMDLIGLIHITNEPLVQVCSDASGQCCSHLYFIRCN